VFTPANVFRSSGPCSRSWFTASSSSGAARRRRAPPLARRRRAGVVASFLGAAQRQRLLLLPLTALSQMGWKGKTPMGLVAWTTGPLPSPLAFEPQRRKGRAKSLRCPGLDCPGVRGGAASSLCAGEDTGARHGGKRGFSFPRSGFDSRAGAPDPSACGSLDWRGHPIARPLRGVARLTRRRVQVKEKGDGGKRENSG
jgi:hypothetical protein